MLIIVGENGTVDLPQGNVLGYVDENDLREHKVIHPKFDGAYYKLVLSYGVSSTETVNIINGVFKPGSELLTAAKDVRAQFKAVKRKNEIDHIFKSEIFTVRILPSL